MLGGACSIIGFILVFFGVNKNITFCVVLSLIVSLFGFVTTYLFYQKTTSKIQKGYGIAEMLLCGFNIIGSSMYLIF